MKKLFLIFIMLIFVGCTTKAPVTQRSQLVLISQSEENEMGEKSYREFISKAKISTDKIKTQQVQSVGKRIALAAVREDFKWEFSLIEDKQINAFCLPGGKVVIYTGILKMVQNEDQLATVMSHEIAHAIARHGAERMSHERISESIQNIGSILIGASAPQYTDTFNIAYGYGSKFGVMLPYSRSHEHEADEIGIHLMKKAGYDINQAVVFWKNMRKIKSQTTPEFLSTHPSDDKRIQRISDIVKSMDKQ